MNNMGYDLEAVRRTAIGRRSRHTASCVRLLKWARSSKDNMGCDAAKRRKNR